MSCESCEFKGVNSLSDTMLMNELEVNLKYWIDWSLLRIGGFHNVIFNTAGAYGGDISRLRLVTDPDPDYTTGQIWESARKDWVWELDTTYTDKNNDVFTPSGVTININGAATSEPYYINYPLGKIVFDNPQPVDSIITAQYCSRQIQTYIADDSDWWNELQFRSYRVDDDFFLKTDTGSWSIGSHKRIQMPTIIIEAVPSSRSRPYQIGDGSLWVQQDVFCHVIAEDRRSRNRLMDVLLRQQDKTITLFSSDAIAEDNAFPLDYKGRIVDATHTYCFLSAQYPYAKCRFISTDSFRTDSINPKLFNGVVKMTCEVALDA